MTSLPYSIISCKAKTVYLLICICCLVSCKDEVQSVNVNGKYVMELPASLTKVNDLNDEASLQYQNPVKELYVIVIDEQKTVMATALEQNALHDTYSNDLEGYSKLITDGMDSSISIDSLPAFEETTINGLRARLLSFEGLSNGNRVYWKLAFIEGNNTYYQIMVWTLAERRKKFEDEMAAIITSFKETDKSKKR